MRAKLEQAGKRRLFVLAAASALNLFVPSSFVLQSPNAHQFYSKYRCQEMESNRTSTEKRQRKAALKNKTTEKDCNIFNGRGIVSELLSSSLDVIIHLRESVWRTAKNVRLKLPLQFNSQYVETATAKRGR